MPHFVIEYSRDVEDQYDIKKVMQIAYESGVESGVMQAVDIKVRATPYDHYRLLNDSDSFVHTTVYLLAGRTDEQKEHLALTLRKNLSEYLKTVTSISIDIHDMNPIAYKKHLLI